MSFDPSQRLLLPLARLTHGGRSQAEGLCPRFQFRRLEDQRVGEAVQPPHDESVAGEVERLFPLSLRRAALAGLKPHRPGGRDAAKISATPLPASEQRNTAS